MIYTAILIYLLECVGQIITACPSLCNCDSKTKTLSCHGWKDTSPPNVSNPDRYEFLDLSSDSGTTYLETECIDLTHLKARLPSQTEIEAEAKGEGENAGCSELLGDALEAGRLPASWLGVGRFMFLKLLRMCGVGLRLVHKDAFRDQLMLRCVDLSHNHLKRLNLFTWHRHDDLHSLILAGNEGLKIPADSPILYSKSLRVLNLSGCQLESLHFCAFDGVPRLKKLDLSNNNLKSIMPSIALPHGLMHLNMSWNDMTYLSSELAESIMNISEVMLNNNPWECDCHLMETWQWVRNLTSEVPFELLCFDRFSNQSWNEVFENETCEIFTNTLPTITTTEEVFLTAADVAIPEEKTEEITEDTTTEEIIYRGESSEIANNPSVYVIVSSSALVLFQIALYVSIWRKMLGNPSPSSMFLRASGATPLMEFSIAATPMIEIFDRSTSIENLQDGVQSSRV